MFFSHTERTSSLSFLTSATDKKVNRTQKLTGLATVNLKRSLVFPISTANFLESDDLIEREVFLAGDQPQAPRGSLGPS